MLPRPFKDLEWHKGKKHRHRRLTLLLRGLLATSRSPVSSIVPANAFETAFCAALHIADSCALVECLCRFIPIDFFLCQPTDFILVPRPQLAWIRACGASV